jgi:shikimate dehydrogenase
MTQDLFHKNTQILGIIGHPIKHSYSPFIHNLAAKLLDMDFIYLPFDVPNDTLRNAMKGVAGLGIRGLNVTLPHKESIIPLLNAISEEASIIGSVNTVVNELGKLTGYNTDVAGVYDSLLPYKDEITGSEISIIGAGGAARAILYILIRNFKPAAINLINRSEQRAEALKAYFADKLKYDSINTFELFPPDIQSMLSASKLVVNATSLGMHPAIDDCPINSSKAFTKGQIVFDVVYNPLETRFLQFARAEGAVTINGVKMLVNQAAKSFELWTGKPLPVDKVYDAVRKHIEP